MRIFVPGIPVPKGSAKAFLNKHTGRIAVMQSNRDRQKPWASLIGMIALQNNIKISDSPISLKLGFQMPRPQSHYSKNKTGATLRPTAPAMHTSRPDLDKLIRCVKDALTGIAWRDDSQVSELTATKMYSERPGVEIIISGAFR